ncbi:MAG: ATP-binding protein [Erysipelotrichaceae bacterium]
MRVISGKEKEAVEEVVGGIVVSFAKRNPEYEINVDIPSELLIVPMDARLITQVLTNLVDNAIKHTSPGNLILIRVSKDDINASFSVIDNGEGISISDLPNIFQMFYTTHTKHSDAIHGIGLGLAICDAIIKAHGGTIEAKNREDGNGSEFTFKLPLN